MSGGWAPRRFWAEATIAPEGEGWGVRLDARALRTPAKAPLVVPTRAFAEVVAAEWAAQGETVDARVMPATRLANAVIDKVAAQRAEVAALVAGYGASDLLCYRAPHPPALAARQAAGWDPLLAWAEDALGARLAVQTGVMPVLQDPAALARLARRVEGLEPFSLAAFHDLVSLSGSLVLALAVLDGWLAPEEAWSLSRLDEDFQIEEWGEDAEAAEAAARRRAAFLEGARFLRLLSDQGGA
jgi:chaperone required for assembly of F1-ATPase